MRTIADFSVAAVDTAADAAADALALLEAAGLDAAESALGLLGAAGIPADAPEAQPVMIELLFHMLDALDANPASARVRAIVAALPPAIAGHAADLLFYANFPDGQGTIAELSDATVLCIVRLLAASGRRDEALAFLAKAGGERGAPRFVAAARVTRAHVRGLDIAALWTGAVAGPATSADARETIAAHPLRMTAHRALVRHLADAGHWEEAVAALLVALALPLGDDDKAGLGADAAVLVPFLIAHDMAPLIERQAATFALAACPAAAAEAVATLDAVIAADGWRIIGTEAIRAARAYFDTFVTTPLPAYPMRAGKPHVDIVWLEVTNFCNQKCGFCPDMHREDARQWQPLDQVKRIIDELAETVSVGSMQLNAYGEPLLHPNIAEILAYIREKQLPWPTFFTTHGMTLVEKKLAQLSHNYPSGIAVSLHNDSQESYAATRSAKIGDYDTLVSRVGDLLRQMAYEGAACHVRLYQMVCNGHEDPEVDPVVRGAFADSPERMMRHVRKWEAIAARIAEAAPVERRVLALTNSYEKIAQSFEGASHGDTGHLPVLRWTDIHGNEQTAFMSPRPVGTYANLLLEYDPKWQVERRMLNRQTCSFVNSPSLAIFATGKLGICCLDMNSTATFGSLDEFGSVRAALESPAAQRIFAQLSNGVATSKGCQICLARGDQLCGPGPMKPRQR